MTVDSEKTGTDIVIDKRHVSTLILLLVFVGCFLFESEDSSQARLSIQGNTDVLRRAIFVEIRAPGWSKALTGADFGTSGAPTFTQTFETPKWGELQVQIVLRDSTGRHVNSGFVSLDIRTDWIWGIDIVLDNHNPFNGCFGCTGYRSFHVDSVYQRAPEDSLFILWGGNSIKHPVIY
jgi:hypothetical protein